MHIYLEHPRHGQKVAISEQEAVYDEKNGWKRFSPARRVVDPLPGEPVPAPINGSDDEEMPAFLNQLAAPKRRGRPPKVEQTE